MFVVLVVAIGLDERRDRLTDAFVQRDNALSPSFILQNRFRLRAVGKFDRLLFGVEVAEIERPEAAEPRTGVPSRFQQCVPSTPSQNVGRAVAPDQRERAVG